VFKITSVIIGRANQTDLLLVGYLGIKLSNEDSKAFAAALLTSSIA